MINLPHWRKAHRYSPSHEDLLPADKEVTPEDLAVLNAIETVQRES